ncbi:MAG: hypothetical protein CMD75_00920 [Gammaproteobacteria bacterium]|nr:hypothetical protein [Gammaproteobacteria bacterium]|tara:strand:- start:2256 stop:4424 length:2169 start_codon:yes stop_codon:yes gene_type:complete
MKTLIQKYSNGDISIEELPNPHPLSNEIVVKTSYSAVSIGTEASIIRLAKKSLIGKAIDRPDLVRRVFQKINQTGFLETMSEVFNRLDSPFPLGYSASGEVIAKGSQVKKFNIGDFVSIIGANSANHSEMNVCPDNMAHKINKDFAKDSAFGMLGCISMNAVRLIKTQLGGSSIAVIGAGILGNITSQILSAYGAKVFVYDPNETKLKFLSDNPNIKTFSNKKSFLDITLKENDFTGVDGVIISCGVKTNEPIIDAINISRASGEIVLLGVADISVDRNLLWEKELSFVVSKAGGPGSLNEDYERGKDYPNNIKKWTQSRNLAEFINLIEARKINIEALITHQEDFKNSVKFYNELIQGEKSNELGVLLKYSSSNELFQKQTTSNRYMQRHESKSSTFTDLKLGVIGAGIHGKNIILPILQSFKNELEFEYICTKSSLNAGNMKKKYKFKNASTNRDEVLSDKDTNLIFSFEPHSYHKDTVLKCLTEKKHLLIEKPICTSINEYNEIQKKFLDLNEIPLIRVGHNRKYSPSIKYLASNLDLNEPMMIEIDINAGSIDRDHWLYKESNGGNRLISECSHFIDLAVFLTGSHLSDISGYSLDSNDPQISIDNFKSLFKHSNGSITSFSYSSLGSRNSHRERIKIYQDGNILELTDYKQVNIQGSKKSKKNFRHDLGFRNQISDFLRDINLDQESKKRIFQEELNLIKSTLDMSEEVFKLSKEYS